MAKYTKRRDKRGYEWKSAYREKEALMLERGYPEVSPHDFYRELFPAGSLQQEPEDGKGNIIATQIRPSGKVSNAITELVKGKILYRVGTGAYNFNPYLFGKGDWQDVSRLRLEVNYDDIKGKTFKTVCEYNDKKKS